MIFNMVGGKGGGGVDAAIWQGSDGYVYVSDVVEAPVGIYADDGYVIFDVDPATLSLQDKTVTPSTSQQIVQADTGYVALDTVTVNAMPSGTAGTPIATKGTVSNHAISVTPSVTNTTGYITGSTKTGTAVSVAASELVSGTKSITENGTGIDVTNYASVDVGVSSVSQYTATITGSGNTAWCYVTYNNQKYYNTDTFSFNAGDTLILYADSANSPADYYGIFINEEKITSGFYPAKTYSYTLPSNNINIVFYYANTSTMDSSIRVYSPIIPTGTLNINSPSIHNVYNYQYVDVGEMKMHTVNISWTSTARSSMYIEYDGQKHNTDGESFLVLDNTDIKLYSVWGDTNQAYVNDVLVAGGYTQAITNYTYTVTSDLSITLYGSGVTAYIKVYEHGEEAVIENVPIFIGLGYDALEMSFTSISCNKTYEECYDITRDYQRAAVLLRYDDVGNATIEGLQYNSLYSSSDLVFSSYDPWGGEMLRVIYMSGGEISTDVYPS